MLAVHKISPWAHVAPSRLASACVIFLIGLTLRVGLVLITQDYLHPPPDETVRVARSLVNHGVFGNPWIIETGATGYYAPVQPFLISVIYWLFGMGATGDLVRYIAGCITSSASYAMLPVIGATLRFRNVVGISAGLAGALLPLRYRTEVTGAWEAPLVAIILMVLVIQSVSVIRDGHLSSARALWTGVVAGVALLITPSLLPVLGGMIVLEAVCLRRCPMIRYVRCCLVRLAAVCIVLLPWTVRNYRELGVICPVRCGFGLELYTSNNANAYAEVDRNFSRGVFHPSVNPQECHTLMTLGEPAYMQEKLHASIAWIRSNPRRFLELALVRFVFFWFPWVKIWEITVLYWLLTPLAIVGLIRLRRKEPMSCAVIVTIWLTFPPIYYVTEASSRFRLPMEWTLLLLAAAAVPALVCDARGVLQLIMHNAKGLQLGGRLDP